ncbi:M13 family metallopeptidase [Sediminibacterium ginsengisoli]|uniref:Putative endopeptidase n=1 Tax=Sediminibacterium ginsengisoli TaxID=413434 RepID=A0A1T4JT28_9BACT|nr:M13 family metallopeptidase [Sediminibacterium ginsengisoli]SJZ33308.1 putative endopeptidase [Sediminibacterium ginsengisoli]
MKIKQHPQWLALAAVLLCGGAADAQTTKTKYIDKSNMQPSVKPGDNFYVYANGEWLKKNPVPGSKTRWGSFDVLREESSKRLQTLLEDAAKNTSRDRKTQIIGDFYASGMDSIGIEKKGFTPISADLNRISALADIKSFLYEVATLRTNGMGSALFGMGVGPDRKNVTVYIPSVSQGGTTLPDRDYYLKDDTRSTTIRNAYKEHLKKMFTLVGEDAATAEKSAASVLQIETELARAQYSRVEMRDPYKTYNKFSVAGLNTLTPAINWTDMFGLMKVKGVDSVLVGNPSFLKTVNGMLGSVSLNDWKSYLRWNVIRSAAPNLSSAFVNQDFAFNKVLTGQKEQTPRWQRLSGQIDRMLGDLVGEIYVEKYFKPEAKVRMLELVNNLQATFGERIKRLDWMSDETKTRALEKLNAFAKKIAYPDKWKTYEGVVASRTDYIGNLRSASIWSYNNMVNRMGKPVDRTEMGMTPPTINASYSPSNNDLTFPAGILQAPFFDFGADDAVNYGGIGAVIGHEMTHGFDDQGRQFAADGNLKDWWTKEDADKFKAKADEVVNQYNALTVLDTIHVNGKLTLGENLADLGGLSIAYEAYTKTEEFKKGKLIDGLTPAQRFFINWAQVWRNNAVPETQAQLILTDPHSPGIHRANAPVTNIDAWYDAFNVKPGDKMYKPKEQRTRIW